MSKWAAALTAYAGLAGAAGVALAASGAHGGGIAALTSAAHFLIMHAAAALGIVAIAARSERPCILLAGAGVLLVGVTLFSGDLAARSFLGDRLFPMAAPIGGTTMILGWLVVVAGGIREFFVART